MIGYILCWHISCQNFRVINIKKILCYVVYGSICNWITVLVLKIEVAAKGVSIKRTGFTVPQN